MSVKFLIGFVAGMTFSLIIRFDKTIPLARKLPTEHDNKELPTVCTYFERFQVDEQLHRNYLEILKLWEESWRSQGWKTMILERKHAEKYFRYAELVALFATLPTYNSKIYELSCYLRWIAAVQENCGWMSDIDMINYGFPPQQPWRGPVLFSFNGAVPSLVTGEVRAFEAVIEAFVSTSNNLTKAQETGSVQLFNGKLHTSDMFILKTRPDLFVDLHFPSLIEVPNLNFSTLLHFSRLDTTSLAKSFGLLPGISKAETVRKIRMVGSAAQGMQRPGRGESAAS